MFRKLAIVTLLAVMPTGCTAASHSSIAPGPHTELAAKQAAFRARPLVLVRDGMWRGEGVAYGMHRDGQRPFGPSPSRAQMAEDLRIIASHWQAIRVYGAADLGDSILKTIKDEHLGLTVMLGAWIAVEETLPDSTGAVKRFPDRLASNRREVDAAIRLAKTYPGIVSSVCVGNETQVSWTDHRTPPAVLIRYLREVRAKTKVPVTTADDFNFWNKPESDAVARECDFIVLHAHPLWNGKQLEEAVNWTRSTLEDIKSRHPGQRVVVGETGWATQYNDVGDQGKLMKGRVGEAEQATFFAAYHAWVQKDRVPSFIFEAFDENWKGGDRADEVEKHWGLYHADRTPKAAMAN